MKNDKLFSIGMAVLWSIVFSNAFHDWTIGVCMGILFGFAFGMFKTEDDRKEK